MYYLEKLKSETGVGDANDKITEIVDTDCFDLKDKEDVAIVLNLYKISDYVKDHIVEDFLPVEKAILDKILFIRENIEEIMELLMESDHEKAVWKSIFKMNRLKKMVQKEITEQIKNTTLDDLIKIVT